MLRVPLDIILLAYLFVFVVGLLVFWFILESRKTKETDSFYEEALTWHCEICSYIYIDSVHKAVSACPRCGSFNQRASEEERRNFKSDRLEAHGNEKGVMP